MNADPYSTDRRVEQQAVKYKSVRPNIIHSISVRVEWAMKSIVHREPRKTSHFIRCWPSLTFFSQLHSEMINIQIIHMA